MSIFINIDHIQTISRKEILGFMDFEKSFDSIYPKAILIALKSQDIGNPSTETLADIYKNLRQLRKYTKSLSNSTPEEQSVKKHMMEP